MSNRFRALLASLTLLISCAPGWTEQNTETPTYRSKTDVVLVPVVVRSTNGPVEGLKPEQVSVTEDGKPQKVASVELIKTGTRVRRPEKPGEFSNELVAPGPARLTIIGIDMINTPFLDQAFARQEILKYLAGSISPDDQFAIFGMYRDGSVRLLHDISSDTTALAAAIKGTTGEIPNSAADTKTTPIQSQAEAAQIITGRIKTDRPTDPGLKNAQDEEQAWQQFKETTGGPAAFDLLRNMEATLSSMRQIGEAFSGAPGRKAFIWITGSFPFDLSGSGDLVSPQTFFAGSSMETAAYYTTHGGALPPMAETSHLVSDVDLSPLRQQFRTLLQQFASGNIALYPVDARGVMTLNIEAADAHTNKVLLQFDKERAQTSQLTIETIAQMTGGKACFNKNDIVSCVRDASRDSEQYYLLSYYRDKKNNKQGWRKLSVKVDQPDVEVRSRTGYFYGSDAGDKNARNRAFNTAMKSSVPFSSVPFSAKFLATTPERNNKLVKFEIYIPPKTVESVDQGDNKLQLEVIAVASTAKDPHVDQVAEMLGSNLPPEAIAAIHQQGIAYDNVLKLPPGEYSVHFLVRNVATNAIGSVIAPLKVE
ncbi:MAG TPA: VWA domain-containing protein [Terriglobales bacterium]|nr:VWA domain-containing protein [Terriglobales bacterium]